MNVYDYSIHYKRFHGQSEIHAAQCADWIANEIGPYLDIPYHAPILDVGCGFGFVLGALDKLGYENTLGLEVSSQQAEAAIRAGHKVVVTDNSIEWMRSNPEKFDLIVLFDVLEHIPVPVQIDFLKGLHTALRPGGKVLIKVPNANAILNSRWRYIDYTHCSSFTEHSLYFVLRNAGFENIWMDSKKGVGRFPRRLWRRSAWPAVRKWIVRWCWLQVFKAEITHGEIDNISFELNLMGVATKHA